VIALATDDADLGFSPLQKRLLLGVVAYSIGRARALPLQLPSEPSSATTRLAHSFEGVLSGEK